MGRSRQYPLQSPWQSLPNQGHSFLWTPANSTTGTGTGYGMTWTADSGAGAISHQAPSNGAPAVWFQMKRTHFASGATTTDQSLGVRYNATEDAFMWRGDAAGLGGFYISFRVGIRTWTSGDRLFCGLTSSNTSIITSDTLSGHVVGLWHKAGDADNVTKVVARDGSSATETTISGIGNLQSTFAYDFSMYAAPNDSKIYWSISGVNADTVFDSGSVSANLPGSSTFLGPQCMMSNGANTGANAAILAVVKIYGHTHY